MLMQLGTVPFEVFPFNTDTYDRETAADFAAKDVMGRQRPREFMGEGDETYSIQGRLYPEKFGGLSTLEELQSLRASGNAQIFVRGDGKNLGWFNIESMRERHSYLAADGVGKLIEFEARLTRAPKPSVSSYITTFLRLFI